jgi:pilus assembly protein Flp/PilA
VIGLFSRFLINDVGATAIEYGLIAGGIALAIVAALSALSGAVKGDFDLVEAALH